MESTGLSQAPPPSLSRSGGEDSVSCLSGRRVSTTPSSSKSDSLTVTYGGSGSRTSPCRTLWPDLPSVVQFSPTTRW
uniref:Uncharacterized protein n=1 Tax=Arundo donax TaxID=35708 RepID=A0A0A9CRI0_ARUDO